MTKRTRVLSYLNDSDFKGTFNDALKQYQKDKKVYQDDKRQIPFRYTKQDMKYFYEQYCYYFSKVKHLNSKKKLKRRIKHYPWYDNCFIYRLIFSTIKDKNFYNKVMQLYEYEPLLNVDTRSEKRIAKGLINWVPKITYQEYQIKYKNKPEKIYSLIDSNKGMDRGYSELLSIYVKKQLSMEYECVSCLSSYSYDIFSQTTEDEYRLYEYWYLWAFCKYYYEGHMADESLRPTLKAIIGNLKLLETRNAQEIAKGFVENNKYIWD